MSVTVALSGLDDIRRADENAAAVATNGGGATVLSGGVPAAISRTPSPRASLSPSPTPAAAATTTTRLGSPTNQGRRHHGSAGGILGGGRAGGRRSKPGLGWSGLPKQMSACSAGIMIEKGEEAEADNKKSEEAAENSSASTNHLDRLKMAVARPLLSKRQSSAASATGSSNPKIKKQYSNLFPCPMVKTLDMDSPEGSLSSLGIVSGLNPHHVGPFASSTSAALMRRAGALGAAAR